MLPTRNCSRCLSDSGVNSLDIGMTSPPRMMTALRGRADVDSFYSQDRTAACSVCYQQHFSITVCPEVTFKFDVTTVQVQLSPLA